MDKKLFINLIITPLIAFFAPVQSLIIPILWLILIDICTGIYAVRITEKKPLTSRGFLKKFPQIVMFLVAVAAALHADPFFVSFGITQYQSVKLVVSFYGIYELFSILENLGKSGLPVAKQLANLLQAKVLDEIKSDFAKGTDTPSKE